MQTSRDGGSGTSEPPVMSNVSVDPGEILNFAKFIANMAEELGKARLELEAGAEVDPKAFGVYNTSAEAAKKHRELVQNEAKNLKIITDRLSEVSNQTIEISKVYADLEELNGANGQSIEAQMAANAPASKKE